MQQTSSKPVTAVHVWQTNVSFWNWWWASSMEWGQENNLLLCALRSRTRPWTPIPQASPWRSTKSGPMPLLEVSHAPSQASAEEEGPRREDPLLVRSSSHEQREVTHQVSHAHCLFCRELELCPEMESAGASSHLRGSSSSPGAHFSSPAPRRPSDPVEGALS